MQTNLFINNTNEIMNTDKNGEISQTTYSANKTQDTSREIQFFHYMEEFTKQYSNLTEDSILNTSESVYGDFSEEYMNTEELEVNTEENTTIKTEIHNNENNFNEVQNDIQASTLLNFNLKNSEIGEKNIDSVKYSLDNNIIKKSDYLFKNSVTELSTNQKDILNNTEFTENHNLEGEFIRDTDYMNTNFELEETILNSQTDSEIQSNEISENQKEIFKQIKEGIRGSSTSRSMQFMLKPNHLGKVNLNLKFFNNAMHINVFVENDNVENLIKQNIEQIISTVNPTGTINIGSINVSKIEDISEKFSKEDSENIIDYKKHKGNPFVRKINYYKQKG